MNNKGWRGIFQVGGMRRQIGFSRGEGRGMRKVTRWQRWCREWRMNGEERRRRAWRSLKGREKSGESDSESERREREGERRRSRDKERTKGGEERVKEKESKREAGEIIHSMQQHTQYQRNN
jgi:hypothetical protein